MIETREKQIGDYKYQVTQFKVSSGLDLLSELTQLLGEGIGRTEEGMGNAARAIVEKLGEVSMSDLAKRLVKKVSVNGNKMQGEFDFETHFAGKYKHLGFVLAFVLEANFEDFFEDLKTGIQSMIQIVPVSATGENNSQESNQEDKENSQSQNILKKDG